MRISGVLTLLLTFTLAGCSFESLIYKQALKQQVDYLNTPSSTGSHLDRLNDKVLTYNWYFDRTMVIETTEGLVVIDSFNNHLSNGLLDSLREAGVTAPIHTLIYTHYHMDHTRGGAVLQPKHVICHRKCDEYWDMFSEEDVSGVLRPTQLVEGDHTLTIGGVTIELISLGASHTDTMYAVYLPSERIVFAADTVGLNSMLPAGGVSIFMPAYLKALDRIQSLDFDTFVSSHFSWGSKEEYIEAADLQRDVRRWIEEAVAEYGNEDKYDGIPLIQSEERMMDAFDYVYERLEDKYSDWHGFGAQLLPTYLNGLIAKYVGS